MPSAARPGASQRLVCCAGGSFPVVPAATGTAIVGTAAPAVGGVCLPTVTTAVPPLHTMISPLELAVHGSLTPASSTLTAHVLTVVARTWSTAPSVIYSPAGGVWNRTQHPEYFWRRAHRNPIRIGVQSFYRTNVLITKVLSILNTFVINTLYSGKIFTLLGRGGKGSSGGG
jgi:hypothetical protein